MNDLREPPASIWLGPVAVWAALTLLALASLGVAYLYHDPTSTILNLAIAGIMVTLLWLFLMDLINAATLVRLIAVAGLLWLSFMFALTFSDFLFRTCGTPDGGKSVLCVPENTGRRVF
jgi:cytochrome c oxidase subunit IV